MSNSLEAGEYNVEVGKTIAASLEDRQHSLSAEDKVEAVPAQWSMNAANDGSADIVSVFPAPGKTAPSFATLPHVVFRDSELPWAHRAANDNSDPGVLWFALIVFTRDELELQPQEQSSFFGNAEAKINGTFGWDISVGDLGSINGTALVNLIPNPDNDKDAGTKTSVIAIRSDLFKGLFTTNSPFRFMSHVRKDDENNLVNSSVVISHRLGPGGIENPTPVFAHLVSLQGIRGRPVNSLDGKDRVALVSLYSWSYNAIPPNTVDLGTSLTNLNSTMLGSGRGKSNKGIPDGHTLVRHRTQTGEEAVAIYRGPLVPRRVPHPLNKGAAKSGTDLQIHDPDLNLIDTSYAMAWQLGKSLALEDGKFTTAFWRLRGKLQAQGPKAELSGRTISRHEVIAGLSGLMDGLEAPLIHLHPVMPEKTDLEIVKEWMFDRLFLNGIPAHYLVSDTSHLPSESLRLFHIDKNWTDALVDGALSLANHLSSQTGKDILRTEIQEALDKRQVPSYGLLLRSQTLVQFPRLAMNMERGSVLVQHKLADDTVLVLLDGEPRGSVSLIFTPVGQPTFTAAAEFLPVDENRAIPEVEIVNRTNGNRVRYARDGLFDWETRTMRIKNYVEMAQGERPESDNKLTSAVLALQLQATGYTITVDIENLEEIFFQENHFSTKAFTFSKDEITSLADEPRFERSS
uniref:WGS project CBMI000000000 data, contig CS3069_c004008 n=1 Tax=Fusarium clavum TaxID=2594811 RepID=A0A090MID9_9HYPO|nr:unnamed protein product [Fusarium clavum]